MRYVPRFGRGAGTRRLLVVQAGAQYRQRRRRPRCGAARSSSHEALEVGERLGDREAASGGLQVGRRRGRTRARSRCAGASVSAASAVSSRSRWCSISSCARRDRILDRLAVPGQRETGRELDRPPQRVEVVAERVGPALGPEADRGRDPAEQVVGGDEDRRPSAGRAGRPRARARRRAPSRRPGRPRRRAPGRAGSGRTARRRSPTRSAPRPSAAGTPWLRNQSAMRCGQSGSSPRPSSTARSRALPDAPAPRSARPRPPPRRRGRDGSA